MLLIVLYLGTRYEVCECNSLQDMPISSFLWPLTFTCDLKHLLRSLSVFCYFIIIHQFIFPFFSQPIIKLLYDKKKKLCYKAIPYLELFFFLIHHIFAHDDNREDIGQHDNCRKLLLHHLQHIGTKLIKIHRFVDYYESWGELKKKKETKQKQTNIKKKK